VGRAARLVAREATKGGVTVAVDWGRVVVPKVAAVAFAGSSR